MDAMVKKSQTWLNSNDGSYDYDQFPTVTEDDQTGWGTINSLIRASQDSLGSPSKVDRPINVLDINQELIIEQLEKDRYVKRKERLLEKKKSTLYQHRDEWKKLEQEIHYLNKQIEEQDRIIHLLNKTKKTIEKAISSMKSIERKVFYAHRYLGKSLVEIAAELEYDYGYIRNLSSKADKKIR
ncbi:MAG: hypothetical protein RSC97_10535 [Eubacterium sp.]